MRGMRCMRTCRGTAEAPEGAVRGGRGQKHLQREDLELGRVTQRGRKAAHGLAALLVGAPRRAPDRLVAERELNQLTADHEERLADGEHWSLLTCVRSCSGSATSTLAPRTVYRKVGENSENESLNFAR